MGFSGSGMRRRVLGAAVAAGAAVPLLLAAPPVSADGGAAGVRGCESGDFKLIYEGREAAAGTDYIRFAMQRIMGDGPGEEPCTVYAPLPVHWVDGPYGERVGDWGRYDSDPPEPFTVEPGGRADLVVRHPNPANYPEEECDPRPVAGVRLYLRFEDDPGVYGSTGGEDVMCAEPGKAVPTAVVTPHGG
ncbi:DUF4232 domain-containing protein [Nocardiopsis potens]|uniref:DUF4232 domain-containing protein n=1 Tax=Nocardiopsis potens TaxID=1246458 RepID=UPI000347DA94|nr:DUF4232 domain-containing protein [Nocardiopsis potens]